MSYFSFKSFRTRYLIVAIVTTLSTFVFISFVEHYISTSSQLGLRNIEERLKVSQLNHSLHSQIQNAARMLELYLLTPTINYRIDYLQQIEHSQTNINSLLENQWIHSQNLKRKIRELKQVQEQLKNKSLQLLQIRLDGEKMYPAMRLANGSMRADNETIVSLLNSAIFEMQTNDGLNKQVYAGILNIRDKWRSTINSYRLYLINRLSSLYESNLSSQSSDVGIFHKSFNHSIEQLLEIVDLESLGIETATALEEIQTHSDNWLSGFKDVATINKTGAWRGDVPIILNDIYPLFDKLYSIIDSLDLNISTASILDLKSQHQTSKNVSFTLWAIQGLLILLVTIGYFIVDKSLLKPLSNLSTSLRESTEDNFDIIHHQSKIQEIEDFVTAYQHMQLQINSRQEKLEHIAMHDELTGLPNRTLLIDRMTLAIANSQRSKDSFAVIILDLDRFKEVNDTLGHFVGDEILKQVGHRLKWLLRETDSVARLGGDEFAILLMNVNEEVITEMAIKISNELENVYSVNEHNLYLGASLGISIYPHHGISSDELLKHADVAMYMAKQSDINYIIYTPKSDENNVKQLSLLSDLRQAIDLDQLRLFYQPIYATRSSDIIGYEALLRWQHPSYGLLMPDTFIQLAEQTGLIKKITLWVITTALQAFNSWPINQDKAYISVNVTAWDLQDTNFISFVTKTLESSTINPNCLMLELSERSMMTDNNRIQTALDKLKELNVRISIDDFGTGFSSLAILKHLPVSILKIDKSFVMKMASNKNDSMIVHSIIDLAHNLELKVIAEGVEDTESRELLKQYNCDYCQGYLFSMPLAEEQLISLLDLINSTAISHSKLKEI